MSQRSYLSIGDVLSMLREEFPDVTISKIRFLESQGLVDPERSPSGYRKFYEQDVARLRWVLRAQRDQFLPLKVIRDRLAAAGNGVPPDEEWTEPDVEALVGDGEEAATGAEKVSRTGSRREETVASTSAAGSSGRHGPAPVGVEEAREPTAGEAAPGAAAGGTGRAAEGRHTRAPDDKTDRGEKPGAGSGSGSGERRRPAATPLPARDTGAPRGGQPAGSEHGRSDVLSASVSGVSLTIAELCAATGLHEKTVADLQSLGLVAPVALAGGAFYDEEALMVGKLAAEFARYGIEPRHLRLYRNAADREVGLVEQVVTPLLRQRNPEARQRAVEAASELARLGQNLRASLIRTALRRQLGS